MVVEKCYFDIEKDSSTIICYQSSQQFESYVSTRNLDYSLNLEWKLQGEKYYRSYYMSNVKMANHGIEYNLTI